MGVILSIILLLVLAVGYARFALFLQDSNDKMDRLSKENEELNAKLIANQLFAHDLINHIKSNRISYPTELYDYISKIESVYFSKMDKKDRYKL